MPRRGVNPHPIQRLRSGHCETCPDSRQIALNESLAGCGVAIADQLSMGHSARWFISAVVLALVSHSPQQTVGQAAAYDLHPFCTGDVPSGQRTVQVGNGAELQLALDRAMAGDVILLATGATFRPAAGEGSIVLRRRPIAPGSWITVRSADKAFDAAGTLPPSTRVGKAHVDLMAKIRATGSAPAIKTEAGAHGYRLIGIDVGVDAAVSRVTNLVELGSGWATSIDTEPSALVIDTCPLTPNDGGSYRRGVAMNGVRLAVVDSYLENFHDANG